jgi:hypothetical protein
MLDSLLDYALLALALPTASYIALYVLGNLYMYLMGPVNLKVRSTAYTADV